MTTFEKMVLRALCLVLAGLSRCHRPAPGWAEETRKFYDDVRNLIKEGKL